MARRLTVKDIMKLPQRDRMQYLEELYFDKQCPREDRIKAAKEIARRNGASEEYALERIQEQFKKEEEASAT